MIQATLNQNMVDEGIARYRKNVEAARKKQNESATKYGQTLLAHSIEPFSKEIETWKETSQKANASRRNTAYVPLSTLESAVVAFLATKVILDGIGLSKNHTTVCRDVGSQIEDELRFRWLKKNHPGLFRKLDGQLSHCMNYQHKRTVILYAMNKAGHEYEAWTPSFAYKVGAVLVELLAKSTGLVQSVVVCSGRKTVTLLQATEATCEWIRNFSAYAELLDPVWLPTVDKPAAWTGPWAGAYEGDALPVLSLVKRVGKGYIEGPLTAAPMPEVYEAINALQETGWAINRRVQGIVQHFWDMGRGIGSLPSSEDAPLPNKPVDIAENPLARKAWKQRAARVHASNAALRSTRLQARKLLNLAQKFANVEAFYFPYQLDFRGRVYTVPTFLTPQGTDLARGLLMFSKSVPIENDADAYWLAVAGANLFGKDKVTFEERIQWVKANQETILAVAQDPLGNNWWETAEEPWQFLAWCFEWAGWIKQGPGFQTRLPVCLDGTNNGLQILSMLTRDEVAAKATNVLPSDAPADIYGDVAKEVVKALQAETNPKDKPKAALWLGFGVDRKTTKRPVMVLPYGGTFHSCHDYVFQWYSEKAKERGIELPEFVEVSRRCHYLATLIWDGIGSCVGRPREAMTWLQSCATVMTKAGLPILWHSPSGFPTLQAYKEYKINRIETTLGEGIKRTIRVREENPAKLSHSRQKNGISPNFVHSLDAAALVRTVSLSRRLGVDSFAMIHDSYGTHAPKVHAMAAALRSAFVGIFTQDWLENLRIELQAQLDAAQAKDKEGNPYVLPPVPPHGDLDVSRLFESEFFFA